MSTRSISLVQLLDSPELPSLPEALLRLNDFIQHDRPIAEITKVIERDPSLATRSLQLANSAWYKRSRTIDNVKDAITTIGLDTLHQLVFATSVVRTFQGIDGEVADMQSFWNQSLHLACNAKLLGESGGEKNAMIAFTCGIVTYVGKLIIYMAQPEISRTILESCRDHPHLQHVEERKLLGFSHNEVTAALLKKWQIPASAYVPIQHYIDFQQAPAEYLPTSAALFLAHHLVFNPVDKLDLTDPANGLQEAAAVLRVEIDQLPAIQLQAETECTAAAALLGISVNS